MIQTFTLPGRRLSQKSGTSPGVGQLTIRSQRQNVRSKMRHDFRRRHPERLQMDQRQRWTSLNPRQQRRHHPTHQHDRRRHQDVEEAAGHQRSGYQQV